MTALFPTRFKLNDYASMKMRQLGMSHQVLENLLRFGVHRPLNAHEQVVSFEPAQLESLPLGFKARRDIRRHVRHFAVLGQGGWITAIGVSTSLH
jgi:hypothetical protein